MARVKYPPRLAHLATKAVVTAKLSVTYAHAHDIDEAEAVERLGSALTPRLLDQLLAETWAVLRGGAKRLDDAALVEKVAHALEARPLRPGRRAEVSAGWSAFLLVADLEAGTASDMARRALETPDGRARIEGGLREVAGFLAAELTRP
jgi:hypothetical protein